MRIDVDNRERLIHISHGNERISMTYSVWTALRKSPTEAIFGPTNDFLKQLDESIQTKIFSAYKEAQRLLTALPTRRADSSVEQLKELEDSLTPYACAMVEDIDPIQTNEWASKNAHFFVDIVDPKDKAAGQQMTYSQEDMFELRVYIMICKILAPLLGSFVDHCQDIVSTEMKEARASELYLRTNLSNWPAHKRYAEYTNIYAARRTRLLEIIALTHKIPTSEIPSYIMGLSIIRRFCIAPLRSKSDGKNIITYIYIFMEGKITGLNKTMWRQKPNGSKGEDDSEDSHTDRFRLPEEVSMSAIEEDNLYTKDTALMIRDFKFNETQAAKYLDVLSYLNSRKDEMAYSQIIHAVIMAIVVGAYEEYEVVEYPVIERLDWEAFQSLLAAVVVVLIDKGYNEIACLLTSTSTPARMDVLNQTAGGHVSEIRAMPNDTRLELIRCYPYVTTHNINQNTNPGKKAIEAIVDKIISANWKNDYMPEFVGYKNIRKEIGELIINAVPQEFKQTY